MERVPLCRNVLSSEQLGLLQSDRQIKVSPSLVTRVWELDWVRLSLVTRVWELDWVRLSLVTQVWELDWLRLSAYSLCDRSGNWTG